MNSFIRINNPFQYSLKESLILVDQLVALIFFSQELIIFMFNLPHLESLFF
jgi:hypothetical protein